MYILGRKTNFFSQIIHFFFGILFINILYTFATLFVCCSQLKWVQGSVSLPVRKSIVFSSKHWFVESSAYITVLLTRRFVGLSVHRFIDQSVYQFIPAVCLFACQPICSLIDYFSISYAYYLF